MSALESSGRCPLGEYEAWVPHRLQAGELCMGEEYMFMMRLNRAIHGAHAARHLSRICMVTEVSELGVHKVDFEFIGDATKNTELEVTLALADGMVDCFATETLAPGFSRTPISGGYFKGLGGLEMDPFLELGLDLGAPKELVTT